MFDNLNANPSCGTCRLWRSNMCPMEDNFIGRRLTSVAVYNPYSAPCHRFLISPEERDRLYKIVLDKLHVNITVDTGDTVDPNY